MPDGRSSRRAEDGAGPAVAGVGRRDRPAAIRRGAHALPAQAGSAISYPCVHPLPREGVLPAMLAGHRPCWPHTSETWRCTRANAPRCASRCAPRRGHWVRRILPRATRGRAGYHARRSTIDFGRRPAACPDLVEAPPERVPRSGSWDVPTVHSRVSARMRTKQHVSNSHKRRATSHLVGPRR